ncbi:hypothetical protein ABID14_000366 [Peptoniphilus olsenii]|uniref:NTP pyrophosphohydrolase MazG putative catalytic core domain-containing protein n=1 Tax=Peptoniphilus olsenii TaxID=411570 RepID=A0ABV2J7I9_9FIRM
MKIKELINKIEQWGKDRELDKKGTVKSQQVKTCEEISELIIGISKNKIDVIKDSIGDIFVTLVIGNMLDMKLDVFEDYYKEIEKNIKTYLEEDKKEEIDCLAQGITDVIRNGYYEDTLYYGLANLMAIADIYGLDFVKCVESAYEEIKGRKGRIIDGTFVKEEDLK